MPLPHDWSKANHMGRACGRQVPLGVSLKANPMGEKGRVPGRGRWGPGDFFNF